MRPRAHRAGRPRFKPRARRLLALLLVGPAAYAGPPYSTDDPEPVDYRHYEAYLFGSGSRDHGGSSGSAGVDFSYFGWAVTRQLRPALQLGHVALLFTR
jgi:hypothetical protein